MMKNGGQRDSGPLLSSRQLSLLDDLGVAATAFLVGENDGDTEPEQRCFCLDAIGADSDVALKAFYKYWQLIGVRRLDIEDKERRERWQWIENMQGMCASTCGHLDVLLLCLEELDRQRNEVARVTTALHDRCEQMVHDQKYLGDAAEAIAQRLDIFDRVAEIARTLDQGNASASDFSLVFEHLDSSVAFLEAHDDFVQAQAFLHQFEHLRNRACISVRSTIQKYMEKSMSQTEAQLLEASRDGSVDLQVFHSRFRSAAPSCKPLMLLLHMRTEVHETYLSTLDELEIFYVHLRIRLLTQSVTKFVRGVLRSDLEMSQLAPATRQASSYILELANLERQCFQSYFELRHPQEALHMLLVTVGDIFYKCLRPVVVACDSVDSLREIADCLAMDVLEPNRRSALGSEMLAVFSAFFKVHRDVQEKLIFRVQTYIRVEIVGYKLEEADLDYPGLLLDLDPHVCPTLGNELSRPGWFPTLDRTLHILVKIYRVLEMATFQGLAQEAVDRCVASLREASGQLSQRQVPDRGNPFGPLVTMLDAQLFLIRHLLVLRESVATFECDLVLNEKYFDFSNIWRPKLQQSKVDSKKDIEAMLKGACETLIANLAAHLTQPLAALNSQIGEFLSKPFSEQGELKEQAFMSPDRLRVATGCFVANLRQQVPFVAAHIRVYVCARGGLTGQAHERKGDSGAKDLSTSTMSGSGGLAADSLEDHRLATSDTSSILFKPVEMRIVDTWVRMQELLDGRGYSEIDLKAAGFLRPSEVRDIVASLFDEVMNAPWDRLVSIVAGVPRRLIVAGAPHSRTKGAERVGDDVQSSPSGTVIAP